MKANRVVAWVQKWRHRHHLCSCVREGLACDHQIRMISEAVDRLPRAEQEKLWALQLTYEQSLGVAQERQWVGSGDADEFVSDLLRNTPEPC